MRIYTVDKCGRSLGQSLSSTRGDSFARKSSARTYPHDPKSNLLCPWLARQNWNVRTGAVLANTKAVFAKKSYASPFPQTVPSILHRRLFAIRIATATCNERSDSLEITRETWFYWVPSSWWCQLRLAPTLGEMRVQRHGSLLRVIKQSLVLGTEGKTGPDVPATCSH